MNFLSQGFQSYSTNGTDTQTDTQTDASATERITQPHSLVVIKLMKILHETKTEQKR